MQPQILLPTSTVRRTGDVLSLGWLPVQERIELELMRFAHRSIWDPIWPQYLRLELHTSNRQLRSSCAPSLKIRLETGTFQDSCSKFFNELPITLRNNDDHRSLLNSMKNLLFNKAHKLFEQ
jgi:hypothetical protein